MECIKFILKFWFCGILFAAGFYFSFNSLYWLGISNHELVVQVFKH